MSAGQGFFVEPDAVRALGELVLRAGAGADSYRRWFDRLISGGGGFDTENGEGFLANAWPKLDEWQRNALSQSRFAADLGGQVGHQLRCVAHWYDEIDLEQAKLLDQLNPEPDAPPVPVGEVRDPATAAVFRDAVPVGYGGPDPAQIENPDWWPVKVEEAAEELLDLGGTLGDLAELIQTLTGAEKDFITMIAEALAGDWSVLQAQAVLYADAAAGLENIAANINQGRFGIERPWVGEAADRAKNWLTVYRASVLQLAQYFRGAGLAIQALARIAYHLMQDIRHFYSAAIDIALLILTEGQSLAVKRGVKLADLIAKAITEFSRWKNLKEFVMDGDLLALLHLVASFNEVVSLAQTAISALLGLAHQFAREDAIEDLLKSTFSMGEPPQWPESYRHRDAQCPGLGLGKEVLL